MSSCPLLCHLSDTQVTASICKQKRIRMNQVGVFVFKEWELMVSENSKLWRRCFEEDGCHLFQRHVTEVGKSLDMINIRYIQTFIKHTESAIFSPQPLLCTDLLIFCCVWGHAELESRREQEPGSLPLKKDVLCQVVVYVEPKSGCHRGSVQCFERLGLGTSSTLAQSAQGKPTKKWCLSWNARVSGWDWWKL